MIAVAVAVAKYYIQSELIVLVLIVNDRLNFVILAMFYSVGNL